MDIDHETDKHDVPRSKVKGEAERAAAEDPSDDIHDTLEDAKKTLSPDADADQADKPGDTETTGGSHQ